MAKKGEINFKISINLFIFTIKELKVNLNTLTEQDKSTFLHSIHQDYDAFIKNNNDTMSRDVLNKEKSFKESLEELVKFYTNVDAQSVREASNKEPSVINNTQSTTLFNEDDAKHQKKHLKKKKKSSSDKKLDANNNNNDLIESDVFEFENFDEKSHDTYENNNNNNKKYISHFDEANSSSQSSQSTDEVDEEEESDTKKSAESGVLKKRNTNIENLGKFTYNSIIIKSSNLN